MNATVPIILGLAVFAAAILLVVVHSDGLGHVTSGLPWPVPLRPVAPARLPPTGHARITNESTSPDPHPGEAAAVPSSLTRPPSAQTFQLKRFRQKRPGPQPLRDPDKR